MSDTPLHELCKGFGALMSRSKKPGFAEEASRLNERGSLPLHTVCSHKPTAEVVEVLLRACPSAASQPNANGNLPLHQAAMWQAPSEVIEVLLGRNPEGATMRNQYGSLPLHMAASNRASTDVVRILIEAYPDALHLQNDDGMTPLDLTTSDSEDDVNGQPYASRDAVIALLQGRPAPPEPSPRQQADRLQERAHQLEQKLHGMRQSSGRSSQDTSDALSAVRRLADRYPHALYCAGVDPNELEIALGNVTVDSHADNADEIILEAIHSRRPPSQDNGKASSIMAMENDEERVRDRIEELLGTIVGVEHIKNQVRGLRRTTEICDIRESHMHRIHKVDVSSYAHLLLEDESENRPRAAHMVFVGNPGTGKTSVGRLLAKAYHELGILRKPKFLEVERMDLVGIDRNSTLQKTREVLDEARGGILFIDEAFTLGIKKKTRVDTAGEAIRELADSIANAPSEDEDDFPLIIMAGFPVEMQLFLAHQPELRSRFPLIFEFPDYSCVELATIFRDLAHVRGFELEENLTVNIVAGLLERETTAVWRHERNGRVSEMLLAGARSEVRNRRRAANFDGEEEVDPHLIVLEDVENVVRLEFK